VIDPQLAVAIGLNEAIVIQQLNYWLQINRRDKNNFRDGYYWTYNTYTEWQKQFPFWNERTVRRIFTDLETRGLVISGNFNRLSLDRTKWYRLDYEKLELILVPQLQQPRDDANLLLRIAKNGAPSGQVVRIDEIESENNKVSLSDSDNLSAPLGQLVRTNNQRLTSETNNLDIDIDKDLDEEKKRDLDLSKSKKSNKNSSLKKIAVMLSFSYFGVDADDHAIATKIGIGIKKYGADKILTLLQNTKKDSDLTGDAFLSECWRSLDSSSGGGDRNE
jgi:hypothetical protein